MNKFAAFAPPAPPADEPTVTATPEPLPSKPRSRGRPRKEVACQSTTIRLPEDLHYKVRTLAFREHSSMSDLLIRAVKEYCEKRAIRID